MTDTRTTPDILDLHAELMNLTGMMTTGDLYDELSPSLLDAILGELKARPPQSAEELAYFAAEADKDATVQRAAESAHAALHSQTADDLSTAGLCFALASEAAYLFEQAEAAMKAAFALTVEGQAQQAAKGAQ